MTSPNIKEEEEYLRALDPDLVKEANVAGISIDSQAGPVLRDHNSMQESIAHTYQYVPLRMGGNGGTHRTSSGSRNIIDKEVSFDDLKVMTTLFYEKAFQDETLDKFIRSHDDPHGERFAKWIHQKMSGSTLWDEDRQRRDMTPHRISGGRSVVVHDRSSAHVAAWHSIKRPSQEAGRHFTLHECRTWMRLHFWAMRESGVMEQSPTFADYYVRFIGHFVAVYERSATIFARESLRWSANPDNIAKYIANGRKMKDVWVPLHDALRDLPDNELDEEGSWPYFVPQKDISR